MKHTLLLIVTIAAILASCSLDYGQSRLSSEISEEIPDTVLTGVAHTVVRDNAVRFRITAVRVEAFSEENRQYLDQVGFTEYDADGAIRTDGTADHADFQTDTEDVELTGNLRFFSVPDEAWLQAEHLYWSSEERQLAAYPEESVVLEKSDGTYIVGRGFTAEMSESLIIFSGGVNGTIVDTE
ncbi:MAG: LPS export ABC transporter periplasmic protein LptC [Spirochaetales bacterium]|nr:LPS export ABC transporter periplasmic protein LptC [Spirochaetales bacterium]